MSTHVRRDAPVLTLRPRAWYSWDFEVVADDEVLAVIDKVWYRERASFTLDGVTYDVLRTQLLRGRFALQVHGRVVAEATKTSAFRRAFELRWEGQRYELRAAHPFWREFRLYQGGVPVGVIAPVSVLRRSAIAQLPAEIPLPVRLFIAFLVVVLWKRQSDAAASSS